MSTDAASTTVGVPIERRAGWKYLMAAGVLIAVIGVLAILSPLVSGIALSILLGALLVVGGVIHVAHAFSAGGWGGALWQVVLAIVYVLAGIALLANPVLGLTTLTILLIAYFLIEGAVEVVMGFRMRPERRWAWVVVSGVVSVLLAVFLWLGFPSTALWAVGFIVGISLLSTGISLIAVAMVERQAAPVEEQPTATDSQQA
jgi:uncharacterized membrane protein HdeD (DUF308 family)